MLDVELIQKLDQVVASFVEIAATTHFALFTSYQEKGFTKEEAFVLVRDYAVNHNNGLSDIACLLKDPEPEISEEELNEDEEEFDSDMEE